MLHTGAYTTRTVAQEALLSAGTSCIAPLEAAIAGSDLNQQRAAVQALGASALPEAVPVLAQVVIDGAKPLARAAIQALGALSQAAAAPTCSTRFDSDDGCCAACPRLGPALDAMAKPAWRALLTARRPYAGRCSL